MNNNFLTLTFHGKLNQLIAHHENTPVRPSLKLLSTFGCRSTLNPKASLFCSQVVKNSIPVLIAGPRLQHTVQNIKRFLKLTSHFLVLAKPKFSLYSTQKGFFLCQTEDTKFSLINLLQTITETGKTKSAFVHEVIPAVPSEPDSPITC